MTPIIDFCLIQYTWQLVRQVHKENRLTERSNEEKLVSVELLSFHIQRSKYQCGHQYIKNAIWKSCYFRAQKRGLCLQTKINQL